MTSAVVTSLALTLAGTGLAPGAAADPPPPDPLPAAKKALDDPDLTQRSAALTKLSAGTDTDFYTPPATLPATNGAILKTEPSQFYLDPIKLLKAPATATRIMYRSTGVAGRADAVTGTVLMPTKAWSGKGRRPLVSYAVGTQGMADRCAPSRQMATGSEYESTFISTLLAQGYAVVVTDYPGLGTPGVHTFAIREPQGHAVLDAARAALKLGLPGLDSTTPVGLSGYSEGGGAVASAAELAPTYAPDLALKGAYVGAPPADLQAVANNIDGTLYTAFALYAINAVDAVTPLASALPGLTPKGRELLAKNNNSCLIDGLLQNAFLDTRTMFSSQQKLKEYVRSGPIQPIMAAQKLGDGRAPSIPVLVANSLTDDVIPFAVGRDLARRWCAQGAKVQFQPLILPTHVGGAVGGSLHMNGFFNARFNGIAPVIDNCGAF